MFQTPDIVGQPVENMRDIKPGAIASNFDTAGPTVSKHLQILTECELLDQKQDGREIY